MHWCRKHRAYRLAALIVWRAHGSCNQRPAKKHWKIIVKRDDIASWLATTSLHTHKNKSKLYSCACVCVAEIVQFVIARVAAATAAKSIGNNAMLVNPCHRRTAALWWLKQHTHARRWSKCAPKTVQLTSRYKPQSDIYIHTHTHMLRLCVACNWNCSARKTRYKLKSHK